MNLERQIAILGSAAGQPRRLALAVLEIVLASYPASMRRVLESAAIVRWYDSSILEAVLDEDLRPELASWLRRLEGFPAIEVASGGRGWNVHETTRLALREQMQAERTDRFVELARRAVGHFSGTTAETRIERAYHAMVVHPVECWHDFSRLSRDLVESPEHAQALAGSLVEYFSSPVWHPATRGSAALINTSTRRRYRRLEETLLDSQRALADFEACQHSAGAAAALGELASVLQERGLPGDAPAALALVEKSLAIREKLFANVPPSADAARDLSVGLDQLGDFLLRRGRSGDAEKALACFERSLELREDIYAANPKSSEGARDLSVSLSKLGSLMGRRDFYGDSYKALSYLERGLELRERLHAANLESSEAASAVSSSLDMIGDFLAARALPGNYEWALDSFGRNLEFDGRLEVARPESADTVPDSSRSLSKFGELRLDGGHALEAGKSPSRCFLLSIGIDQYQQWPPLRVAATGALEVASLLSRHYGFEEVRTLTDRQATRMAILGELVGLAEKARPEDSVVIYFAGHGHLDPRTQAECWIPADALAGWSEETSRAASTWLPNSLVKDHLKACPARQVLLISDSCFGGDFIAKSREVPAVANDAYLRRSLPHRNWLALMAGSMTSVEDSGVSDHSIFTGSLLRVLRENDLESCRASELVLRIRDEVTRHGMQPPVLVPVQDSGGEAEGEFVFFRQGGAPLEMDEDERQLADATRLGEISQKMSGLVDQALAYFERSLEVLQRLLVANPESAKTAREVSVRLNKLGRFLSRRGDSVDTEKALACFERSLSVREALHAANRESAQAAGDLMVSFEHVSAAIGARPGGQAKALELQLRALEIARSLHQANPASGYLGRTTALAYFLTAQRADAAGQVDLVGQCLGGCHQVLRQMLKEGMELDPVVMKLYRKLKGQGGRARSGYQFE